jgi:hypothetical protein
VIGISNTAMAGSHNANTGRIWRWKGVHNAAVPRAVVEIVKVVLTGFGPVVTTGGENEQDACGGKPAVQANDTGPLKPFWPPTVRTNCAGCPAVTVCDSGGVTREKSGAGLNVAVTERAAFMLTTQLTVPMQAPPQPAKTEPVAAVAVRVTFMLVGKDTVHAALQFSPAGLLTTLPLPVPLITSCKAKDEGTAGAKVAVTL